MLTGCGGAAIDGDTSDISSLPDIVQPNSEPETDDNLDLEEISLQEDGSDIQQPAENPSSTAPAATAQNIAPAPQQRSETSAQQSNGTPQQQTAGQPSVHTHTWSAWKVTKTPTQSAEGLQQRTCTGCGATEQQTVDRVAVSASEGTREQEVFRLVNEERTKRGHSALTYCDEIQAAADLRAKEIVTSFSHARPDGRSCFTVFDDLGLKGFTRMGENIAYGYPTPESVMNGWMNSDGHRANILNTEFTGVAVGVYGNYWVQLFVRK